MSDVLLCPSTMCIDFHHLDEDVKTLDESSVYKFQYSEDTELP